jgi:hypothetical protein
MRPPSQRFEPNDRLCPQIDQRLIVGLHSLGADRSAKLAFDKIAFPEA